MQRGEVWWAALPEPVGARPVLLLSRDKAIALRTQVTVAHVTTLVRGIPVEVPLSKADGMPRACVANLDVINTIDKSLLKERVCRLSPQRMTEIAAALRFALSL